jgi:flagellar biosynthesis/type III secretory pathway chaperone
MQPPINSPISVEQSIIPESKQGLKILANELLLQRRHRKSVRDQNSALLACDRKRFAEMHEQFVLLQGELEVQNKLRMALFGTRKLEKVISTWPESDRRNAEKIVAELGPVVREVREVNRQNRSLVGNELKYMDFMMNLLVSTYRKGSMYGPRGGLSINQGNLFFNSAA